MVEGLHSKTADYGMKAVLARSKKGGLKATPEMAIRWCRRVL
jgi:hypothetical protein